MGDDTGKQAFLDRTYSSDDGLTLHLRDYDPGRSATAARLPVICLPGLTRNARDFHRLALILSQEALKPRRVIALDYRGRGLSDWDGNKANYNLVVEAGDVMRACAYLGIDRAVFIGTSRGGLILHFLAVMKPELLAAAVLNDVGPVIEAYGLMQIRDDLNAATAPLSWDQAAETLKMRHGVHFPALTDDDWAEMATAIYRETNGRIASDVDPAIAAQLKTIDFGKPLPDLWTQYQGFDGLPLMVVRGENSALLSEATLLEMAASHADLSVARAPGQGHPPLLHSEPLIRQIKAFLETI
ncbi:alpha/beta fold hydrolase [Rhizobium sp. 18055]|uniref:alpha/beta fold hydrolase n=1 Tax=Rhizobium sp. 18055 TaxID=2681403 RepID=UPI0013583C8A|nr:alpha/beta hydrolase [Rhizobium sp. 18055]